MKSTGLLLSAEELAAIRRQFDSELYGRGESIWISHEQSNALLAHIDAQAANLLKLRRQLHSKDEALREKNEELDALHYVWCDGYCAGGVHRYTDDNFTEEVVLRAEYQARRLRKKWNTMRWVIENWPELPSTQHEWHRQAVERLKRKLGYKQEDS